MSFLVPVMLLGTAAAAVPVVIHLLNRRRFRVVKWGAMHLLDSVLRTNRKRLRLEQLILLAVRASLPAFVALFMARPVLTSRKVLPGDSLRSVVILLDDSYSMGAGGAGESDFAHARREADRVAAGLRTGSDAALIPMSGLPGALLGKPTFNIRALRKKLRRLEAAYGTADVARSLERALDSFRRMNNADRELLVLSDFQRVSWGEEKALSIRRAFEKIRKLAVKPHITFFPLAASSRGNVCVETVSLSRDVVGVGRSVKVKAVLRNLGKRKYEGLRVHFRVDGEERETTEITLDPGERNRVIFVTVFEKPGSHYVEVTADADSLTADNRFLAALPVWDSVPVLLMDGDRGRLPLESETDYLEVALQPFAAEGSKLSDLIRTRTVTPEEFDAASLNRIRVVVMANVKSLDPHRVALLEDFVKNGGGLLLFVGDRCDLEWYYNYFLKKDSEDEAGGLLPCPMISVAGSLEDRTRWTEVVDENFTHEVLVFFNLPGNGSLGGAKIRKWIRLGKPPVKRGEVMARLASGDPFLVEGSYGEGRVVVCATACDDDWSDLPLRPFYLPLCQRLVTYLASKVFPPRNVEVGDSLAAFLPTDSKEKRLTVKKPDGEIRKIKVEAHGNRRAAVFTETLEPGLYVMKGTETDPIHFVVNTSREESDLETLSESEVEKMAADVGADVVRSGSEYEKLCAERRHGREVWRYFFWIAFALLFAELFLEQLFSRKTRIQGG